MKWTFAKITDAGPRSANEDAVGVWSLPSGGPAAAVADGLGGMGGGKRASEIAISEFGKVAGGNVLTVEGLFALAMEIHEEIRRAQTLSATNSSMATTLSAGIVLDGRLLAVHCGDTRISVARGVGIKRLTRDQTEGQRLFEAGKITKEELIDYPRKNILDSALGVHGTPAIQKIEFEVFPGDKIFFSSDGLHNVIPLRELWDIANKAKNPEHLISLAESLMAVRTKDDNFSLIALFLY